MHPKVEPFLTFNALLTFITKNDFRSLQYSLWLKDKTEPGKVTKSVKCLPHKHEDLSVILSTIIEKLDVAVLVWNPSTGEEETGGFPKT